MCKSKGSMKPGGEVKARLRRLPFGAAVGSRGCVRTLGFQRDSHRSRCRAEPTRMALVRELKQAPGSRSVHGVLCASCSMRAPRSMHAMTRKIVNYAWRGRSPRKLGWRPVAVVTCKSMVSVGHRGERPIELSSSWFHPKFLSG